MLYFQNSFNCHSKPRRNDDHGRPWSPGFLTVKVTRVFYGQPCFFFFYGQPSITMKINGPEYG